MASRTTPGSRTALRHSPTASELLTTVTARPSTEAFASSREAKSRLPTVTGCSSSSTPSVRARHTMNLPDGSLVAAMIALSSRAATRLSVARPACPSVMDCATTSFTWPVA